MNRKIKFRFWNGEEMMYSDLYAFEENMIRCLPEDLPSHGITHVMQYTGLKDKNGKDIYEGDLVLGWDNMFGKSELEKWRVVFSHGSFVFLSESRIPRVSSIRDVEIIGNIHTEGK